jgi:hypothetical protein
MSVDIVPQRMIPAAGCWWAAYSDGSRRFVLPVVCFDEGGMPYVWDAATHRPATAVRTEFVGLVSDAYRGEYGELIGKAITNAAKGHVGEAIA